MFQQTQTDNTPFSMKSFLEKFMPKAMADSVSRKLKSNEIELVSDELALKVRGGDKDYSPTYEHEVEKQSKFTDPSILLKF